MRRIRGNKLKLGMVDGRGVALEMTPEMRSMHLYICGATGTGKTKMLESLIQQDIKNWHKSKCGALVIDPHGSLYDSLINWIAWNAPYLKDVPIVPIDLRQNDWTIAYNALRPRAVADPSVALRNFVLAMAYVWDTDGTSETPTFARLAKQVLWALYDKKLSLLEAEFLIDSVEKRIRTELTTGLSKSSAARGWAAANEMSRRDFETQYCSTINRFSPFLDTNNLRLMFGQNERSLDLGEAIEAGQIIIANVSTQGGRISQEDASLFSTILLSDLWTAASERGKGIEAGDVKPYYVYVDEFQNCITPTIAQNLDEARGFGLHLTLANQFPRQILHGSANGQRVYDSVMENARSKIVFSLEDEEDLKPLAKSLFLRTFDPDQIKLMLTSYQVVGHEERLWEIIGESANRSEAVGYFDGTTATDSEGRAIRDGQEQEVRLWNMANAVSIGTSRMNVAGTGRTRTLAPYLNPIVRERVSSVQYRPLEDQLHKAMVALADQQERHSAVRLVGMRGPVSIVTPTVSRAPTSKAMLHSFLTRIYENLPFALRSAEAHRLIEDRQRRIKDGLFGAADEPKSAKRRVR